MGVTARGEMLYKRLVMAIAARVLVLDKSMETTRILYLLAMV